MGTLFYGDDGVDRALSTEGGKMEGDLNISYWKLYGVAAPIDPSGAVSKQYMERHVASVLSARLPSGLICMWSGVAVPSAWKLCDGSNGTPNLRDRFIMGASGTSSAPGATGGSSSHTLTLSEMPPHRHEMPGYSNHIGTGTKSEDDGFKNKNVEINVGKSEGDERKLRTEHAGGTTVVPGDGTTPVTLAAPFSTVPPYYVLAFIMKM